MTSIDNRLRQLRKQRGLTMEALAALAGTSQQQIDRLEKGQRRMTVQWMIRLSEALGCDMFDLVPPSLQPRHGALTARAKVVGTVRGNRRIELFAPERRYPILFGRPEKMLSPRMFALVVGDADTAGFPRGTELVFSEIDHAMPLRDGQVVICAPPAVPGAEAQHFLERAPLRDPRHAVKAVLVKSIRNE